MPSDQGEKGHPAGSQLDAGKLPGDNPMQARNVYLRGVHVELAAAVDTGQELPSSDWQIQCDCKISVD